MSKFLLFAGFGLLPLWVAIIVVVVSGLQPGAFTEHWSVAPWLIFASLPVSAVTTAIALLVSGKFKRQQAARLNLRASRLN